jgi:hypothetical protein
MWSNKIKILYEEIIDNNGTRCIAHANECCRKYGTGENKPE